MNQQTFSDTPTLVLIGPTAIGKTDLSLELAARYNGEVISMDSMQVYRYMDIGTAKVSQEEQQRIPHHLIDIRYPNQQYNAAQFVADCTRTIEELSLRGKIPVITGGTGLYLQSLLNGLFASIKVPHTIRARLQERLKQEGREVLYAELRVIDRESAKSIHINDTQRLVRALEIYEATGISWSEQKRQQKEQGGGNRFKYLKIIGLNCEREQLYQRIARRADIMLKQGIIEEVTALLAMGYTPELPAMQAIGYRHIVGYIQGKTSLAQAQADLVLDTRRYAKRQLTWFKKTPGLIWFDRTKRRQAVEAIDQFMENTSV
ncbi:MAG: tRNA (adenosine(37)-N6)-dimethylallyltransferase MiaA [Desulfobulbus propionicus]|nr:MAG: tRNA (adenosine(37)-N6)-dimethylallyltransferase MiaA [Desulfobulbus propionicus]